MAKRKRVPNRLTRAYSGVRSRKFWARVNALPFEGSGRKLYALGCQLQELESAVLYQLKQAEELVKRDRDGR